ncbi:hypothetical protein GTP81_08595 [Rugamonas sp. FT107W]|uniref:Uncharacterized protein n=1 Tax=Duganella vulcania TaxID=2692166 RepID=A0A845HH26_9BURK|nr:hypothetical protein [Duganella vulcania]MYN16809.1 hypothetical protein [Duganella vulcania]
MMTIRPAQMEALIAPQKEIFATIAVGYLSKFFPEDPRLTDRNAIGSLIADGGERAHTYAILGEPELLLYLFLVFERGLHFELAAEHRWMKTILDEPSTHGEEKMSRIFSRLAKAK